MAGVLTADRVAGLADSVAPNGTYLAAAASAGYPEGQALGIETVLQRVRVPPGAYSAFVELHIEQGPELEAEGLVIGTVTAIAAPAALRVAFYGDGGHAGGQLMHRRNDAALAGAELSLVVEAAALSGAPDAVGTTGAFRISPGVVNSVPREALLEIDIRDINGTRRDEAVAKVVAAAAEIAARRKARV